MYAIHTTPGFIIHSRPHGEAGKTLSIFTRDLGLVLAAAQGIRLEKSKLRYHAQEHSFGVFSLVRGKEVWRLTSAMDADPSVSSVAPGDRAPHELIVRLAALLRRLLHGEEAHPELFSRLEECLRFVRAHPELGQEHMKTLESLAVLRILHALGYIGADGEVAPYIGLDPISADLLDAAAAKRSLMNQHINKALRESHL
jgi:recombinational DNA repair protein (RecF pathway)